MQRFTRYLFRRIGSSGVNVVFIVAVAMSAGCSVDRAEDSVQVNLRRAGKNRSELQKVLDHYIDDADTLKLKAAEFLIEHLDAQQSEVSARLVLMVDFLNQTKAMNQAQLNQFVDSIDVVVGQMKVGKHIEVVPDLETVTADLFIDNIDQAFDAWYNSPWAEDISFDVFTNFMLPYKTGNSLPQSWRGQYTEEYKYIFDSLPSSATLMDATNLLLSTARPKFRFIKRFNAPGTIGGLDLLHISSGQCYEWAHLATNSLRQIGVPTTVLYAPQWGSHSAGHAWLGIMDSVDRILSYAIEWDRPVVFNPMRWALKTAKVFMRPYEKNNHWLTAQPQIKDRSDLPIYLKNPRIVDVTDRMIPVTDVDVHVKYSSIQQSMFMYLCVFKNRKYEAIHWSHVIEGKAHFDNMGRDVLYIPAFYSNGEYTPAADPVIISYDGEISSVTVDTSSWQIARIYRKYALRGSMSRYTRPFMGMIIQVGGDRSFTAPVDLHTIDRYPSPVIVDWVRQRDRWSWEGYIDSVVFETPVTAQYLRFLAAPSTECIVGEIECYNPRGQKIDGVAFGSKEGAQNILDGIYGETYHDPDSMGWVAIDFGEETAISKIRYLPSHDSNSIQVEDRYELLYWDRGWQSLGEQIAEHKYLDWRVPTNALFWLRNLDRGKEERPFTLDPATGKQVWW